MGRGGKVSPRKPRVGLIGLGAMGRVHYDCWRKSNVGELVAVCDRDPRKLAGAWGSQEFNLGNQTSEKVDLSDLRTFALADDLFADSEIDIVDICMPTLFHAPLAIAALRAGKHVFCEKPMALNVAECLAMEEAASIAGRQLVIGHCLRYWSHYVKAREVLQSGEFGRPQYASLRRSSAAPVWSSGGWLMKASESGGVLDMHIHDIDMALWWFGHPRAIAASGFAPGGLPLIMDARWDYDGFSAQLHSSWDRNGGEFHHAFKIIFERATLSYDLATDPSDKIRLLQGGRETLLQIEAPMAYHAELDDFAAAVRDGMPLTRITPAESRIAVEVGLEELHQISAVNDSARG